MNIRTIVFSLLWAVSSPILHAQTANENILSELKDVLVETDDLGNRFSPMGYNTFLQRKVLNYLTGTSDLSLAKFYASYSTDNDKLNLGFNIPITSVTTVRLRWVLNPIFEADVKSSFATLYAKEKWQNNIRLGAKVTRLFGKGSSINFYKNDRNDMPVLRSRKYLEIATRLKNHDQSFVDSVTLVDGTTKVKPSPDPTDAKALKKRKKEIFEEVGKAEADFMEASNNYAWSQYSWLSAWAFMPLTESEQFVGADYSQAFTKEKFKLWEFNIQFSYLRHARKCGTIYTSFWAKYFQNNSAIADLMDAVDYRQYHQVPQSNPQNLALLENSKAYVGDFKEFKTLNLNLQFVYFLAAEKRFIKPGISARIEQNIGKEFSPTNFRFGIPIAIQGKEKPIDIELQYRLNDVFNYKDAENHKIKQIVGISLGFPIILLYK